MKFLDSVAHQAYSLVATLREPPSLTPLDIAWADRGDEATKSRDDYYRLYQWYYRGQQRDPRDLDFADTAIPTAAPVFSGRHNFCGVVVKCTAERLNVRGLSVTSTGLSEEGAKAIATTLWDWWQRDRMDATQGVVHTQSLVKGDAYLLVHYDAVAGHPRFAFHDALKVTPVYDADHRMTAAYKTWTETYVNGTQAATRFRITKYTPGFIEKYAREGVGGTWRIWPHDTDANGVEDGGIIVWQTATGEPLGIPFVHFKNNPDGEDFGHSELADLVPAQDEYNDRHWSTSEAMRYQGSPQRYVVGIAKPPEGGWDTGPGAVWTIEASGANPVQVGQFAAGNVAELQDATDRQLKTIAAMSRTPLHLLWPEGALPSGESLKSAEAGLVAKVTDRSVTLGNGWEDAMALAIRLYNAFSGQPPIREDITISTQWGPFQTRSELTDEQVIGLRRDDISREQALRERGYTEEEIVKIMAEKEAETPESLQDVDRFGNAPRTGEDEDTEA